MQEHKGALASAKAIYSPSKGTRSWEGVTALSGKTERGAGGQRIRLREKHIEL